MAAAAAPSAGTGAPHITSPSILSGEVHQKITEAAHKVLGHFPAPVAAAAHEAHVAVHHAAAVVTGDQRYELQGSQGGEKKRQYTEWLANINVEVTNPSFHSVLTHNVLEIRCEGTFLRLYIPRT